MSILLPWWLFIGELGKTGPGKVSFNDLVWVTHYFWTDLVSFPGYKQTPKELMYIGLGQIFLLVLG